MVHGVQVVGPIVSSSLTVAKFAAAERALAVLKDPESEKCLTRICICGRMVADDDMIDSLLTGDKTLLADQGSSDFEDDEEVEGILTRFEGISSGSPQLELSLLSDPGNLM